MLDDQTSGDRTFQAERTTRAKTLNLECAYEVSETTKRPLGLDQGEQKKEKNHG